jgi:hypothetical protein
VRGGHERDRSGLKRGALAPMKVGQGASGACKVLSHKALLESVRQAPRLGVAAVAETCSMVLQLSRSTPANTLMPCLVSEVNPSSTALKAHKALTPLYKVVNRRRRGGSGVTTSAQRGPCRHIR